MQKLSESIPIPVVDGTPIDNIRQFFASLSPLPTNKDTPDNIVLSKLPDTGPVIESAAQGNIGTLCFSRVR
jgi:hypothetical protein